MMCHYFFLWHAGEAILIPPWVSVYEWHLYTASHKSLKCHDLLSATGRLLFFFLKKISSQYVL